MDMINLLLNVGIYSFVAIPALVGILKIVRNSRNY
jgi:hypothetical protein